MAVVQYQQRNIQNLQALINYLRDTEKPTYNEIGYAQARLASGHTMVLLGKGHAQSDVAIVSNTDDGKPPYSGHLSVYTDKTKRVFRPTEHKLIVYIYPDPNRKGGMAEIEAAIRAVVQGMTIDISQWPIEFQWQ